MIGLWLTPYLLKHLGIAAYGLIPLAMFLSQYVSVIINAINMSINRFLLIALQKKQDQDANEIFNTSLVIILVFIVVQALVMGIILFDITTFFTIPQELIVDATWLFGLTFVGFSISLFRSVFGTSMFAYNRLDILRTIDIVQNLVRVISIVSLFMYDEPSLKYIGMANLLAALSAVVPTLYYFKKFTPQLKVNVSSFSKHRVSELSKMSTWVLINQVGVLLLGNIDLYLVNKWIGTQATGEYAIVLQFISIVKVASGLLAAVFAPVFMIYYAEGQYVKLRDMALLAIKVMSIVTIIPLSIIIYFSGDIISVWLGSEYSYIKDILSFSLLFLIFTIPIMPLYNITISFNRVKIPAMIVILNGLINVSMIYLLLTYTDLGLWAVVLTKLVLEIGYTAIFVPLYVANILKTDRFYFSKISLISIFIFISIYFVMMIQPFYLEQLSLINIIIIYIFSASIFMPILYKIIFTKDEQYIIISKYKQWRKHV